MNGCMNEGGAPIRAIIVQKTTKFGAAAAAIPNMPPITSVAFHAMRRLVTRRVRLSSEGKSECELDALDTEMQD